MAHAEGARWRGMAAPLSPQCSTDSGSLGSERKGNSVLAILGLAQMWLIRTNFA